MKGPSHRSSMWQSSIASYWFNICWQGLSDFNSESLSPTGGRIGSEVRIQELIAICDFGNDGSGKSSLVFTSTAATEPLMNAHLAVLEQLLMLVDISQYRAMCMKCWDAHVQAFNVDDLKGGSGAKLRKAAGRWQWGSGGLLKVEAFDVRWQS